MGRIDEVKGARHGPCSRIDNRWSARLEAVSWRFVQRFSTSNDTLRQVRALILLEEFDRVAYLVEVRGWKVDRDAAIAVLANHWYEFMHACR